LNILRRFVTLRGVKWFKATLTVVMLALWLPATSHALLEQVGWIHTAHADADDPCGPDHDNDHDAADGICHVASNDVQVPQPELNNGSLTAAGSFSLMLTALFEAAPACGRRCSSIPASRSP